MKFIFLLVTFQKTKMRIITDISTKKSNDKMTDLFIKKIYAYYLI